MRAIRFRAWSKEHKLMAYDVQEEYDTIAGVEFTNGQEPGESSFNSYLTGNYEVMQFTGLHDRNGKEIWEGDIVKAWVDFGPGGEHEKIFPVTFGPWGVNLQEWTFDENRLPKVIGNIYENPEILEGGKEKLE